MAEGQVWKMCFDKCHLIVATMKYAKLSALLDRLASPPAMSAVVAIEQGIRLECREMRSFECA